MGKYSRVFGSHNPDATYVAHSFAEHSFDAGKGLINYASIGKPSVFPLLLIPGQSESYALLRRGSNRMPADVE